MTENQDPKAVLLIDGVEYELGRYSQLIGQLRLNFGAVLSNEFTDRLTVRIPILTTSQTYKLRELLSRVDLPLGTLITLFFSERPRAICIPLPIPLPLQPVQPQPFRAIVKSCFTKTRHVKKPKPKAATRHPMLTAIPHDLPRNVLAYERVELPARPSSDEWKSCLWVEEGRTRARATPTLCSLIRSPKKYDYWLPMKKVSLGILRNASYEMNWASLEI